MSGKQTDRQRERVIERDRREAEFLRAACEPIERSGAAWLHQISCNDVWRLPACVQRPTRRTNRIAIMRSNFVQCCQWSILHSQSNTCYIEVDLICSYYHSHTHPSLRLRLCLSVCLSVLAIEQDLLTRISVELGRCWATEFGEITQNNGHYTPFKVMQGHDLRYQRKARMAYYYWWRWWLSKLLSALSRVRIMSCILSQLNILCVSLAKPYTTLQ